MTRAGSLRFFLTVTPAPAWMRLGMATAAALGVATLWLSPGEIDSALGSVLLLQMFAASTGYRAAASRGFFDPLLVSGRPMWRVAGGHLVAAALPGVLAWIAIVIWGLALGEGAAAAAPQRQLAIVVVTAVAWSTGLVMPRMAGGVLWCALILAFAMSQAALGESFVVMQRASGGLFDALGVAAMACLCPFLLLGNFPALTRPALGMVFTAALAVALAGGRYICRRDHPLVEPS